MIYKGKSQTLYRLSGAFVAYDVLDSVSFPRKILSYVDSSDSTIRDMHVARGPRVPRPRARCSCCRRCVCYRHSAFRGRDREKRDPSSRGMKVESHTFSVETALLEALAHTNSR